MEIAQRNGEFEAASRLRYDRIPTLQAQIPSDTSENATAGEFVLRDRVTSEDVANVVARATGIPVQNLLKGEKEKLIHVRVFVLPDLHMQETDDAFVRYADGGFPQEQGRWSGPRRHRVSAICPLHCLTWLTCLYLHFNSVSDAVRLSRAGLQNPERPLASFLFLGPTGYVSTAPRSCRRSQADSHLSPHVQCRKDGAIQGTRRFLVRRREERTVSPSSRSACNLTT